jgi:hypothetical protein
MSPGEAYLKRKGAMLDSQRRLAFAMRAPAMMHAFICAQSRANVAARVALSLREAKP